MKDSPGCESQEHTCSCKHLHVKVAEALVQHLRLLQRTHSPRVQDEAEGPCRSRGAVLQGLQCLLRWEAAAVQPKGLHGRKAVEDQGEGSHRVGL